MINQNLKNSELRRKRSLRVRVSLRGTKDKPRLCVIKSNKHIQAQLIDDESGHVLASVATFSKSMRSTEFGKKNKQSARKLGEQLAEMAKGKQVTTVVFDRGPFKYHGILAELADAARAGGLQF